MQINIVWQAFVARYILTQSHSRNDCLHVANLISWVSYINTLRKTKHVLLALKKKQHSNVHIYFINKKKGTSIIYKTS